MSASLRVLWLIRGLGPGGAEKLLVAHARAGAPDIAYEVAYQVAAKDHLVPELEAAGVVVHRLGTGPGWPLELRRLVRTRAIDVVHAHAPVMAVGARLALRALPGGPRPALAYTEHNRWDAYRWPTRLANACTFRLDHRTLAVSDEARSSVSPRMRQRVTVVHHGIDGRALAAAVGDPRATRRSLGLPDDAIVAVHVANFRREKAHEVMVAAAEVLRSTCPQVRILMVGQGQLADEVAAMLAARDLAGTVDLLGYRADVAAVMGAADLLVLSSDHEGLPVAVMEALALGLPVVATDVGGLPEAVHHGIEGLLVPARDPQALAAAIAEVATDPELRRRLGAGAAERGRDFDAERATRTIEDEYRLLRR